MTRSGKSVFELERIRELLRTQRIGVRDTFAFADLGADSYLRNGLEELAHQFGKRFREFSLSHERLCFDPFQAFRNEDNPSVMSGWASAALQLQHGPGYGKGHFSAVNEVVLLETFETLLSQGQAISLENLVTALKKRKGPNRDAIEAINVLLPLLHYPQLRPQKGGASINIADSIDQVDIVYFSLDCLRAPAVARVIAGLATASLILASIHRYESGGTAESRTFITVDEFSQLANPAWGVWLTAAGKHGCFLSLLYQSTAQLKHGSDMLADIVRENCRTHIYFTCVGSEDIEKLREMSSETRTVLGGRSGFGTSITPTSREVVDRALSVNEILNVSATDREYFAVINEGTGHKDPVNVITPIISPEDLKRRSVPPAWMKETGKFTPRATWQSQKPEKPAAKTWQLSQSSRQTADGLQALFDYQIQRDGFSESSNS